MSDKLPQQIRRCLEREEKVEHARIQGELELTVDKAAKMLGQSRELLARIDKLLSRRLLRGR
jgi:hypothetical protein